VEVHPVLLLFSATPASHTTSAVAKHNNIHHFYLTRHAASAPCPP
jgi:hypothetical protein